MAIRALVTGVTGQDGSYLAELLLQKGYEVHGIVRPERLAHQTLMPEYLQLLLSKIVVHGADLRDITGIAGICRSVAPDETYHLGGPSRVDSNVTGSSDVYHAIFGSTKALLDAVSDRPGNRFFLASTSEIFGNPVQTPQTELSARNPRSLYGFAKLAATDLVARYRTTTGGFACTGILFNHESTRREPFFLSRKVTRGLARVALGRQQHVSLGNLDALRDWGYAPDYVEAMWGVLQHSTAADYVVATGKIRSVRQLVETACSVLNLDPADCIEQDPRFFRPLEPIPLCGDPHFIEREIGWRARKSFEELIREMVLHDLDAEKKRGE
ncbi:GDP-mannose 4,6-dehydratase [Rhizobium sp. J15]|uniref:GDP-mannose 4,6-dehydratase n=1 Tax=Rhizobium sp. J15 TaxID=2035450 RepID=UPI001596B547|nr:GDP-mannose 4,6-dehydratase [Rhizobium sp. J15]